MTGERKTNDASFKRPRGVRAHKIMYPLSVDVNFRTEVKQIWIGCESDPIRLCTYPIHVNLVWTSAKCKGSSQKFAHRGQTKELSYGGGGGGGGEGFRPDSLCDRHWWKKKAVQPSTERAVALADESKSQASHFVILKRKTSPTQKDMRGRHAAAIGPSQISIGFWRPGWRRKIVNDHDRHSLRFDTVDLHRPPTFVLSWHKKKKKVEIVGFFVCSRFCLLVNLAMDAGPSGKRPCVSQTTLFGRLWGRTRMMCTASCHTFLPLSITLSFEEGGRG